MSEDSNAMAEVLEWTIVEVVAIAIRRRIEEVKLNLETNDKPREIATLQGKLKGYRILWEKLEKEFGLYNVGTGMVVREEIKIDKLSNAALNNLKNSIITHQFQWEKINEDLDNIRIKDAQFLYDYADKVRDLDLTHGKKEGMLVYQNIAEKVLDIFEQRRKNEPLFADDLEPEDEEQDEPDLEEAEEDEDIVNAEFEEDPEEEEPEEAVDG